MQELITFAINCGFNPQSVTPDGALHRFKLDQADTKESGYYIFFQNFAAETGQTFYAGIIGSWRGEEFHYNSPIKMSKPDRELAKKRMAEASKKAAAQKLKHQEETAIECEHKLATCDSGSEFGSYIRSKGLNSLYGAKTFTDTIFGTSLYIPMRDINGKLWNLQKIQPNGEKFFFPGGKVEGNFHTIGGKIDENETIYIAEGFATSASIFEAIGKPVVCAFNAGNLPKVAGDLKRKYPDAAFIICGDEDKETTGNPGRTKAEEAAKITLGTAVFPQFKSNGRGTDFNDLHQEEGIEAVKEQISPVKAEKHYIIALGYDEGNYFFTSNVNPQIQRLPAGGLNSAGLCRLQPLAYWESIHPANKGGVNWTEAADQLMQECHSRGIFRSDRVRGRGVWKDAGRTLYHRGRAIVLKDEEIPITLQKKLNSKYIYELCEEMPPVHPNPLSIEECEDFINVALSICWKDPESFMYFAGWIAVAPMGAALTWRPHLWVTGASDSGKSHVIQNIVHKLLEHYVLYLRGATTEAGMRQRTGCSTRPVLFDEFETNDEKSGNRVLGILEFARQASSDSDGSVSKGTISGTALEFKPQFCMLAGSVRTNTVHVEDENRFTKCELQKPLVGQAEQYANLLRFESKIGSDYGMRLFARMFTKADTLLASIKVFYEAIGEEHASRTANQYGTLLAGFWILQHDLAPTLEQARSMCRALKFNAAKQTEERKDEEECLNHLLSKRIKIDNKDYAVSEAVHVVKRSIDRGWEEISRGLMRIGIKVDNERGLLICRDTHPEMENQVYSGTRWSKNWNAPLARLPGVSKTRGRIGHENIRFLTVPFHAVEQWNSDGTLN